MIKVEMPSQVVILRESGGSMRQNGGVARQKGWWAPAYAESDDLLLFYIPLSFPHFLRRTEVHQPQPPPNP
jgi:hypothetical protein